MSVWASEFGLSLGQVACDEKSNEITAIPELLRLVDMKGSIITIDAMGTQKAIAEQIVASDADYVLALKGNQETLHQAVDRLHRRAARERLRRDRRAATSDPGDGTRPPGDADLHAHGGSRELGWVVTMEGSEVNWHGDFRMQTLRWTHCLDQNSTFLRYSLVKLSEP